jgi:hypothetical protein
VRVINIEKERDAPLVRKQKVALWEQRFGLGERIRGNLKNIGGASLIGSPLNLYE